MVIIVWSQNKSKKAHLRSGTMWFKGVKYIYEIHICTAVVDESEEWSSQ